MSDRCSLALAAALSCLILAGGCQDSASTARGGRQTARESNMVETGELQAVSSSSIFMPWFHYDYGTPQITRLENEGLIVAKGEVVGQVETAGVLKLLDRKKLDLAIAMADFNKMRVDQETQMKSLESELQSTGAALKSAEINTQRVEYESPMRQEIAELQLEKAKISLEKVGRRIESTRWQQKQDLKIQQAKITQIRLDIERAQRTIDSFTLRAPADGMIVYSRNWATRNKVNVGDQIWPGNPLILLPDLSKIKVLTAVNEIDIQKVYMGQEVKVKLDAYPKIAFDGEVTHLSKVCHPKERGSRIKVFDVEAVIKQTHRILKPGMTASCEFIRAD